MRMRKRAKKPWVEEAPIAADDILVSRRQPRELEPVRKYVDPGPAPGCTPPPPPSKPLRR
ncbi:hypothetical protein LCGC14_0622910 [marine sediment metagenome]|uniref:Uncharacterized protein n=1 Tax=marine sediment metagenome TaxID=412755 RepID=A0A0F9R990_9ZZZZ